MSEIGSGSQSTVYEAVVDNAAASTTVALKLIGVRGDTDAGIAIASLALDHPSLVRYLDSGITEVEEQRVAYLAMELLHGETLRARLDRTRMLSETVVAAVGRQLAAALCVLHDADVVHRDIKPANVFLTACGGVKLLDLGFAANSRWWPHDADDRFTGTALYAAPEQFTGAPVGPSVDLYALGVVLFEAATGVPPFAGDQFEVVAHQHLQTPPPSMRDLDTRLSDQLAAVVDRLLSKDPTLRPTARQAASELATISGDSIDLRTGDATNPDDQAERIGTRRATPMVGRDAELSILLDAVEQAGCGQGSWVVIEGDGGVGKSRLLAELSSRVATKNTVLLSIHRPGSPPHPSSLATTLYERLGLHAITARQNELGTAGSHVPGFVAHMTGDENAPSPSRSSLVELYVALLESIGRERPVVWLVDDLHLADSDSVAIVAAIGRVASRMRVALVATTRPSARVMTGEARVLRLTGLRLDHVTGLAASALGTIEGVRVAAALTERSGGNPLFVLELLRSLGDRTSTTAGTMPRSIRELLRERLRTIEASERDLLEVAALQNDEFDVDLIARTLGLSLTEVRERVARIVVRTGLIRTSADALRFDHQLLRECVTLETSPNRRRQWHGRTAEALAERDGIDLTAPESVSGIALVRLTTHLLRADRIDLASPLVVPALRRLSSRAATDEIVSLSRLALDQLPESEFSLRVRISHVAGNACLHAGRLDEAKVLLDAALVAARRAADTRLVCEVMCDLGAVGLFLHRYDDARSVLRSCVEEARRTGDRIIEIRAAGRLGGVLHEVGELDKAQSVLESALRSCDELGRPPEAYGGGHLANLGNVFIARGDYRRALDCHLEGAERHRAHGNHFALCHSYMSLVHLHQMVGDLAATRLASMHLLALSRTHGLIQSAVRAHTGLAEVARIEGRFSDAEATARQAADLAYLHGHRRDEGEAVTVLGLVQLDRAQLVEAEAALRRAAAVLAEAPLPLDVLLCDLALARTRVALHRSDGLALLRDVAIRAEANGEANPGTYPAALLAALGERDPSRVVIDAVMPCELRAAAHEALFRATRDSRQLERARELVGSLSRHLVGGQLEVFWRNNPIARAIARHGDGQGAA